jgi:hypothetical protein
MPIPIAIAAGVVLRQVSTFAVREIAREIFVSTAIEAINSRKTKLNQTADDAADDLLEFGALQIIYDLISAITVIVFGLSFLRAALYATPLMRLYHKAALDVLIVNYRAGKPQDLQRLIQSILSYSERNGLTTQITTGTVTPAMLNALAAHVGKVMVDISPGLYNAFTQAEIEFASIPPTTLIADRNLTNPVLSFAATQSSNGEYVESNQLTVITDAFVQLIAAEADADTAADYALYVVKARQMLVKSAAFGSIEEFLRVTTAKLTDTESNFVLFSPIAAVYGGAALADRPHGYVKINRGLQLNATALPMASTNVEDLLLGNVKPLPVYGTKKSVDDYSRARQIDAETRRESESDIMSSISAITRLSRGAKALRTISSSLKRLKT